MTRRHLFQCLAGFVTGLAWPWRPRVTAASIPTRLLMPLTDAQVNALYSPDPETMGWIIRMRWMSVAEYRRKYDPDYHA